MLKGLAFRLGFILCLALIVRVGAALFGPSHDEPKLASGSESGDGILASVKELAAARRDMDDFERSLDKQLEGIEREKQKELERQANRVSFEPGQPMVDPTPRS
jgi:hypothetical protein